MISQVSDSRDGQNDCTELINTASGATAQAGRQEQEIFVVSETAKPTIPLSGHQGNMNSATQHHLVPRLRISLVTILTELHWLRVFHNTYSAVTAAVISTRHTQHYK